MYKVLTGKEAENVKGFTLASFPEVAAAAEERKKKIEVEFKPDHEKAELHGKKVAEFVLGGFDFEYGGGYRRDEILKKTTDEAEAIIAEAKNKASDIERAAFEKGHALGREQGRAESAAEITYLVSALNEGATKLTGARDEYYANAEKEMVDLVVLIASEIIAREIKQDKNIITDVIRKSVAELHSKQNVLIRLNSADMANAVSIREDLLKEMETLENVDFTSDNSVTPGGCFIKTGIGMIDATVEGRLADMHRNLKGHLE
ncbi:MAG: hypothetical protein HY280_02115 [Nitrospinae bacterium]|nr:hypothetical protein [Nitrospinota bacterium]